MGEGGDDHRSSMERHRKVGDNGQHLHQFNYIQLD